MIAISFIVGTIIGITAMAITLSPQYDKGFCDGYNERMCEDHLTDCKRGE